MRVAAVNGAVLLCGSAGLAFALFNALAIGTAKLLPLIAFDLATFFAAACIGTYLWRTGDVRGSAIATSAISFVALLGLVGLTAGRDYFILWAMLYPPLAFMLHGIRGGCLAAGAFLVALFAMAFLDRQGGDHGQLSLVALSNLVGSVLVLTAVVAVYEAAHRHMQRSLAASQERLRQASIRDGLTGAYNRRHFDQMLPREMARAGRESRRLALLLLDADHFKDFNDRHGHPAGDRVLISIARTLERRFRRAEDLVFRVGGEEFAVLFRVARDEEAVQVAESVREAVAALPMQADGKGPVTVSAGLAVVAPRPMASPEEVYARADRALYRAKRAGRNRVVRVDDEGH